MGTPTSPAPGYETGFGGDPTVDADVTRANIVARMDSLVAESKPGDLVLFAYAGHGMQTPEYARWQGIDPDGVNEQIALSGFSFSGEGADEIIVNPEIRAWLSRLDAKGVDAVVIDECLEPAESEQRVEYRLGEFLFLEWRTRQAVPRAPTGCERVEMEIGPLAGELPPVFGVRCRW